MFDNWSWFNNLFGGSRSAKDAAKAADEKYEELVNELRNRLKSIEEDDLLFSLWNDILEFKHLCYNAGFEKAKELFRR